MSNLVLILNDWTRMTHENRTLLRHALFGAASRMIVFVSI
jgi:hypothetical protein